MQFRTPAGMSFEIPDEWWACADMNKFSKGENQSYSCWPGSQKVDIVPLAEIEPPQRGNGIPPFKKYKLNLTKIESRPTRQKAWEYIFFVDFIGHRSESRVQKALDQLERSCVFLKVLGSYPRSE